MELPRSCSENIDGEALREELLSSEPIHVRHNLSDEQLLSLADAITSAWIINYDRAVATHQSGAQLTWKNSVGLIEAADAEVMSLEYVVKLPSKVAVDKQSRVASSDATKKLKASSVELSSRKDVFEMFLAFSQTEEAKVLNGEAKRYVYHRLRDFQRRGLHLDDETAEEVKKINTRLSAMVIDFENNLDEVTTALTFTEAELAGCPETYLSSRKSDDGNYKVVLDRPSYTTVMERCKVAETRRQMELAWNSRCKDENTQMLKEFAALRHKKANLMGYSTHLAFVTETLMSGTDVRVTEFLSEMGHQLKPAAKADLVALKELKAKHEGGGEIMEWDRDYYCQMRSEMKHGVDHEALKEYFPLETVTAGLLDIYQGLLGLKFEREPSMEGAAAWHEDVKAYKVSEASDGKLVGFFYLDMHPREGKAGGAITIGLQRPCMLHGRWQYPISAIVCNFSKPTSTQPALLSHKEATDFFHEFGHAMHHVCSKAEFEVFSGMRVEKDFLEAPSQMLENWCYQPAALRRMSAHYKTGEPIPDELMDALIASSKAIEGVAKGNDGLWYYAWASLDVAVHTAPSLDPASIWDKLTTELVGIPASPGTMCPATFVHIVDYDGMFYSYQWSAVYAVDMFASRFEKEGIFNPETGASYRKEILAPGGSRDAMESLKAFLGREPSVEPFLKAKGLAVEHAEPEQASTPSEEKPVPMKRKELAEVSNAIA